MNAHQRRRFARSAFAAVDGELLKVVIPNGFGIIAAAEREQLDDFERDTQRDLARSGGPSLFRSCCRGILRAVARWRRAQTQALGSTSPTQADDTSQTRSG